MTDAIDRSMLLRRALQANAGFSALSAFTLLAFAGPASRVLGAMQPGDLFLLGMQLAVFSAWVLWLSLRPAIPRWQTIAVIALDALWVAGSAAVLVAPPPPLTAGGKWAVALVALAVLTFADLQFLGLRRLQAARSAANVQ